MTTTPSTARLDKWLICSDPAFQSISGFWRTETGTPSLLDWRLTSQMIEPVPREQLATRLEGLAQEGSAWNLLVVVDMADIALLQHLQHVAPHMNVRLVEWGETPLAAILGMNAPDQAVLAALQAISGDAGSVDLANRPADLAGYVDALNAWENACRANDADAFALSLPAFADAPIPWHTLLAAAAQTTPQTTAANDNWVELVRLAAATSGDDVQAVSLEDPRNTPAQWTLTLAPIDAGPATLAVFRVNEAAIPAFRGCTIRLRVLGDVISLGEVDEDGQAEIILPSPIAIQGLAISWDEGK